MPTIDPMQLFTKNPLFKDFTVEEIQQVIDISQRTTYKSNDLVFSQKQEALYVFLVESGEFALSMPNSNSKIFTEGDVFGEIAVINRNMRSGTVRAKTNAVAHTICGTRMFKSEFLPSSTGLKLVRALSVKITNYLRSREQISTLELIQTGENEHVEVKSSLWWNKHTQKRDPVVEHAIIKTIAGFLNAEGGTLLVGVNDESEIVGLKHDNFVNDDKILLYLNKLIKDKIGTLQVPFINSEVERIGNMQVLRVDCESSSIPSYLKDKNHEYFYVRTGPATTNLKISKVHDYIRMRFYKEGK